jgi:hypothetical protein
MKIEAPLSEHTRCHALGSIASIESNTRWE